jgi:hypothetical protein
MHLGLFSCQECHDHAAPEPPEPRYSQDQAEKSFSNCGTSCHTPLRFLLVMAIHWGWNRKPATGSASSGLCRSLIATMVFALEPPIKTLKRGSDLNCARLLPAATRGNASTSPDSSAAAWAAGSLMKRIVTLASLIAPASR